MLEPALNEPQTALDPTSEPLSAADLTMVNLETAVTEGGTPAPDKEYLFRAPASALEALNAAETGVLTLTFDQGNVTQSDWAPAQIQDGVPVPYEGDAAEQATQTWVDMCGECELPLTDSPA